LLDGVKVAVVPLYVTVPVTPPTVNVAAVTVEAFIVSENVAVILEFVATPVALFAGLVDETVGGVVSVIPPPELPPPHAFKNTASIINNIDHIAFEFSFMIFSPFHCPQ